MLEFGVTEQRFSLVNVKIFAEFGLFISKLRRCLLGVSPRVSQHPETIAPPLVCIAISNQPCSFLAFKP